MWTLLLLLVQQTLICALCSCTYIHISMSQSKIREWNIFSWYKVCTKRTQSDLFLFFYSETFAGQNSHWRAEQRIVNTGRNWYLRFDPRLGRNRRSTLPTDLLFVYILTICWFHAIKYYQKRRKTKQATSRMYSLFSFTVSMLILP
jgi:hypothetical protein